MYMSNTEAGDSMRTADEAAQAIDSLNLKHMKLLHAPVCRTQSRTVTQTGSLLLLPMSWLSHDQTCIA